MATTERDFYQVLGVERNASDADIKRAFRKLAQQWHPDVNTDPAAQGRFKEINEAYQVLSDPQRRQTYDMFGRAGLGGEGARPPAPTFATTSGSLSMRLCGPPRRRSSSRSSAAATPAAAAARNPAR